MTIKEILSTGGGVLVVLMCLVQVSPIEINPWSWLAKKIGRAINGEVLEKVEAMEKKLSDVQHDVSEEKTVTCRVRILRFGDECTHGTLHSKEYFDQVLQDIKVYDQYCQNHPEFENDKTVITTRYIKDLYRERLEKGDFI